MLPAVDPRDTHSFWFVLLRLELSRFRCSREELVAALVAEGAHAVAGYIPKTMYRYPLFQNHDFFAGGWPLRDAGLTTMDYRTISCPVAEAMLTDGVSLPISPTMSDELIDQTADALAKVVRHFAA
jgi:dTDP-4-amino-4,6-dideoxygalactose transaminase